tara:strand:- start:38 stop:415 length:378 start_codon:yes stop_codon:yes gene_type:complete
MRKYILIFMIISCLACDGSTPVEPPDEEMTPEMMEDIFYDILLMKAIKNSSYVDPVNEEYFTDQYIYEKYGIDSLQLAQNQIYYAQKPKLMKKIFENIEIRSKQVKDSIDTIMKRKDRLKDEELN